MAVNIRNTANTQEIPQLADCNLQLLSRYYHTPNENGLIQSPVGLHDGPALSGLYYAFDGIDDSLELVTADIGTLYISSLDKSGNIHTTDALSISYNTDRYQITATAAADHWNIKVWTDNLATDAQKKATSFDSLPVNLFSWHSCDEGGLFTCYDRSGNGRHFTLVNVSLPSFHSSAAALPYSFLLEKGYSIVSATYIPLDESSYHMDVLGNALAYAGKTRLSAQMKQAHCISLDGIDDYVSLNSPVALADGQSIKITATVLDYDNSSGHHQAIIGSELSDNYWIGLYQNSVTCRIGGGTVFTTATGLDLSVYDHLYFSFELINFNLLGSSADSITMSLFDSSGQLFTTTFNNPDQLNWGATFHTTFGASKQATIQRLFSGKLCDLRFYIDNLLAHHYPMAEGAGDIVHDAVAANHGSITNASYPAVWDKQDVCFYNFHSGFWRYFQTDTPANIYYAPIDLGASVTINSIAYTRSHYEAGAVHHRGLNNSEAVFSFPEVPSVRATGIDPAVSYDQAALVTLRDGNTFLFLDDSKLAADKYISNLLLYQSSALLNTTRINNYTKTPNN